MGRASRGPRSLERRRTGGRREELRGNSKRHKELPRAGWFAIIVMRICYILAAIYRDFDRILDWLGFASIEPEGQTPELDASEEPDGALGPILTDGDAPRLFELLRKLSRRMGAVFPAEVRLSYLPTCGVLDIPTNPYYSRKVLILGLPCLQIWSIDELKAVLAHELAHLNQEDAAFTRDVLHYAQSIRMSLARSRGRTSIFHLRRFVAWLAVNGLELAAMPVIRAMEYRADRWSAQTYGSGALSTAIEKMAVVQPIFREILLIADETSMNVYRTFARAWKHVRGSKYEELRKRLVERAKFSRADLHPPVCNRLDRLRQLKAGRKREFFPSLHLLEDPHLLENVLHNCLFGNHDRAVSVFGSASSESGVFSKA